MNRYFFALMVAMAPNLYASEIYKCVDQNGKQVYSDKKCPKATAEKIEYNEASLDEQLKALAPGKSKIANLSRKDGETLIDYEFNTNAELTEFMRLSKNLSGKHVYLIKVVMPKDNELGKAHIKITTEPGLPFSDPQPQN
ncbi:MAG TPA: DUF4124 domain-containing protein [Cellvibrio sp.]|nr:DUF4124 domain-containing protein [Cellvibrio sp.]